MASNGFDSPRVIAREKRSKVPQIRGTGNGVGSLIGRALRGPANVATRVTSFSQWQRIFGGFTNESYIPEQVRMFFRNGGTALYFTRVVGSGGGSNVNGSVDVYANVSAASGYLVSNNASFPAVLLDGDTFSGKVDGGGAVLLTIGAKRAAATGAGATYAAVTASHVLLVTITGVLGGATQTITFAGTENTQALFLAAINAQLVGGNAINSAGQVRIQTDMQGSSAGGTIAVGTDADVLASLGLSTGAFAALGVSNVSNVSAVTAAEFAGLATTAFVGSTTVADIVGNKVTWTSATTGGSSSVQFNLGTGVSKIPGFDNAVHSGNASSPVAVFKCDSKGPGYDNNNFQIQTTKISAQIGTGIPVLVPTGSLTSITIATSVAARISVGDTVLFTDATTGGTVRAVIQIIQNGKLTFEAAVTLAGGNLTVANTVITLETFSAAVLYDGSLVQGPLRDLRMSPLSARNYFVTRINTLDIENLVTATSYSVAFSGSDLRPTDGIYTMSGGNAATVFTDADYIGNVGASSGLYSLDRIKDVRMCAIPGITGIGVVGAVSKALIQYCETRENILAITSSDLGMSPTAAQSFKANSLGSSSYYAFYYPWIQVVGSLTGQTENIPPEGAMMGLIARSIRNEGLQKAPAGETTGKLVDTVGVERELGDADTDLLYPNNINCILNLEDVGQCVMGSRTGETGDFNQIHIRQTFIYLRESMQKGTRFALFIENNRQGRAKVARALFGFLYAEWKKGTLTGDTAEEAFTIQCDDDNNTDATVKQQQMFADVEVNIPQTTENLGITIQQDQRGNAALAA